MTTEERLPVTTSLPRSVLLVAVSFVMASLLGYVFNVLASWLLTAEQYGQYGVGAAFLNLLTVPITAAFPIAAAKLLSSDGNQTGQCKVIMSSVFGNLTLAAVESGLFFAMFSLFLTHRGIDRGIMLTLLGTLLATSVLVVHLSALQGLFRFGQLATLQAILPAMRLAFGLTLVYIGLGAVGALVGGLLAAISTLAVAVFLVPWCNVRRIKGWIDSRVFVFAPSVFFSMMLLSLLLNLDILGARLIGERFVSEEFIGYYQGVTTIARIPFYLATAIMAPMFSFISRNAKSGDLRYPVSTLKYAVLLVVPLSIVVATRPAQLITLLYPSAYSAGAKALAVEATGMGMMSLVYILVVTFQALGRASMPAIALMGTPVVQMAFMWFLVPRWGLVGAATATALACALSLVILAAAFQKLCNLRIAVGQVLRLLVAFSVVATVNTLFPMDGKVLTFVGFLSSGVAYVASLAVLRLVSREDLRVLVGTVLGHEVIKKVSRTSRTETGRS